MLKYATPQGYNELRITLDEFLKLYKEEKAILVDIRMPFEKKIWSINFAVEMSPEELENEYQQLPKDKLIVTACPGKGRSPFTAAFLKEKGFNAKFLDDGLLKLTEKLKGGEAKKFWQ